jgi:hypothetical protein
MSCKHKTSITFAKYAEKFFKVMTRNEHSRVILN